MSPDILGPNSGLVVGARALLKARDRREERLFLVEGPQAVREALAYGFVQTLFVDHTRSDALGEFLDAPVRTELVSPRAIEVLTETNAPQGVVAVCAMPRQTLDDILAGNPTFVVVGVGINDPGNLGTIIRTGDAAGADAVCITAGSADAYNGKTIRSTAGSLFHLPVVQGLDEVDTFEALRAAGLASFGLAGQGATDLFALDEQRLQQPLALWLGSEAHGLAPALVSRLDAAVAIPMPGRAESLNVATAGAVAMYAVTRARLR